MATRVDEFFRVFPFENGETVSRHRGNARVLHVLFDASVVLTSTRFSFLPPSSRSRFSVFFGMAPKTRKTETPRLRVANDSPYIQTNILNDAAISALADNLRAKRPVLRSRSALLKSLPFQYSAIYQEPSLQQWLLEKLPPSSIESDFLLVRPSGCLFLPFFANLCL